MKITDKEIDKITIILDDKITSFGDLENDRFYNYSSASDLSWTNVDNFAPSGMATKTWIKNQYNEGFVVQARRFYSQVNRTSFQRWKEVPIIPLAEWLPKMRAEKEARKNKREQGEVMI